MITAQTDAWRIVRSIGLGARCITIAAAQLGRASRMAPDELLGAVYDVVAAEVEAAITAAGDTDLDRARANPVLTAREQTHPAEYRVATYVAAAMYTGAMTELAQQWVSGKLGEDLDAVVEHAVRLVGLGG